MSAEEIRKLDNQPRVRSVQRMTVIAVTELRGNGEAHAVCREVTSYWTEDGEFVADNDPEAFTDA